jgi:hypothetical protein
MPDLVSVEVRAAEAGDEGGVAEAKGLGVARVLVVRVVLLEGT